MRKTLCERCKFYSLEDKEIVLSRKATKVEKTIHTFKVCSAFYPPIYINANSSECNFHQEQKKESTTVNKRKKK